MEIWFIVIIVNNITLDAKCRESMRGEGARLSLQQLISRYFTNGVGVLYYDSNTMIDEQAVIIMVYYIGIGTYVYKSKRVVPQRPRLLQIAFD